MRLWGAALAAAFVLGAVASRAEAPAADSDAVNAFLADVAAVGKPIPAVSATGGDPSKLSIAIQSKGPESLVLTMNMRGSKGHVRGKAFVYSFDPAVPGTQPGTFKISKLATGVPLKCFGQFSADEAARTLDITCQIPSTAPAKEHWQLTANSLEVKFSGANWAATYRTAR